MYKKEFTFVKNLAIRVGEYLLEQEVKYVNSLEGRDIKLQLDKDAEKLIIDELRSDFHYPILSEEIGLVGEIQQNKPYWIVDPIDGTLNYSRNCPLACVSIALWMDNQPLLGVVYDFFRKELFSGVVGEGAWLNNKALKREVQKKKSQAILATGFPTYLNLTDEYLKGFMTEVKKYKKIRMLGSAALSLCYVACGRVDAYQEEDIKLWDVAAGIAINQALNHTIRISQFDDHSTNTFVCI